MKRTSAAVKRFIKSDSIEKNRMVAILAMWGNYILAVVKFAVGVLSLSIFLIASGFYSIGMGVSRGVFLKGFRENNINNEKSKIELYTQIGIILLVSSLLYGAYMLRFIFTGYVLNLGLIIPIAIAAVAFTELVVSIVGIAKALKHHDILYKAISNINLLTALAAIALTQISILHSKIENASSINIYNGLFGLGVAIIGILIGARMIMKGVKKLNNKEIEE